MSRPEPLFHPLFFRKGIGGLHDVRPAAEIIDSMMLECEAAIRSLNKLAG